MEDWSPNQVSLNGKLFSIESEMFSNILTTFSVYNEVDTSNVPLLFLYPFLLERKLYILVRS